jgi:hypothetical protein
VIVDEEACREGAVRYIKGGMHQAGSNKLVNSKLFTMRSVHFLPAYILALDYASFGADGRSFEGAGAASTAGRHSVEFRRCWVFSRWQGVAPGMFDRSLELATRAIDLLFSATKGPLS